MGPQRVPWPLLGLPRPRRACRRSWVPRAPDTAGSTELRPKGDATISYEEAETAQAAIRWFHGNPYMRDKSTKLSVSIATRPSADRLPAMGRGRGGGGGGRW